MCPFASIHDGTVNAGRRDALPPLRVAEFVHPGIFVVLVLTVVVYASTGSSLGYIRIDCVCARVLKG